MNKAQAAPANPDAIPSFEAAPMNPTPAQIEEAKASEAPTDTLSLVASAVSVAKKKGAKQIAKAELPTREHEKMAVFVSAGKEPFSFSLRLRNEEFYSFRSKDKTHLVFLIPEGEFADAMRIHTFVQTGRLIEVTQEELAGEASGG